MIGPYARGRKQRVGSAIGGVLEDWIGSPDGISRGLIVPEATTNQMTNPVFGHGTWDNGWTDGAGVDSSENTNEDFLLFGTSSAKVLATAGANNVFYQSIDVANAGNTHVLSCYAKLPDGGVISASQCQLYYGAGLTTAYTPVGNGCYRLTASLTGAAPATGTGLLVVDTFMVYTDGFQIEEKAYSTPLTYGDLMGSAWTGTAHASTTNRTGSRVMVAVDDIVDVAEGTLTLVWKAGHSNTFAADRYLFHETKNSQKK